MAEIWFSACPALSAFGAPPDSRNLPHSVSNPPHFVAHAAVALRCSRPHSASAALCLSQLLSDAPPLTVEDCC